MIQTARSRTPATDTDDSEGVLFPRKGLKPKVSSYLTQQSAPSFPSRTNSTITNNAYHQHLPSWSTDQTIPDPDVGKLIDSVMSRLLAEPYCGLDSRFNGSLLQIFEAFRHVNDENIQLQSLLEQEINKCSSLERAIHESAKQWSREREEFQAEVRRLELIVAKGERGLAEVTLVRQDSLLRYGQRIRDNIKADKTLETVFEFLERTRRREDAKWNSQRGKKAMHAFKNVFADEMKSDDEKGPYFAVGKHEKIVQDLSTSTFAHRPTGWYSGRRIAIGANQADYRALPND